jgi:hypothetical protein
MLRNFAISKQTEDRVKLAKQYVECTNATIQPSTRPYSITSTYTKSPGIES